MILPCHYTTPAMISLLFYFVITPGLTSWGSYQSISCILSSFGLYWLTFLLGEPTFHIITSFKLLLGHVLAMLAHPIPWASLAYFISWAFSAHFFFLYLFYSYELLLNPLGFLDPITTSLPLIIFRVYWPLCQHFEFTNSFLGLPRPIYFFFTSYYSHVFTTSFLGLPWPICFFFVTFFFFFCRPVNHYSCCSGLLVFASLFSLPIFFILLGFFSHCAFCQKWASTMVK